MTSLLDRLYQHRAVGSLRVRRVSLRDRGLDLGIRIVLASDLHARNDWFDRRQVARVVDEVNAIDDVDLVALVGDFVGDDIDAIDWSALEYARIDAATVGVLGNHDHWLDAARVQETLEQAGVAMLTNRAVAIGDLLDGNDARGAWLAGIDSCWTRRGSTGPGADPDAAFRDVPEGADVVVLGHEPHLATLHEHALHLAGHTHCGQVRTPVFGDWTARLHMPRYSEPFPCRLYEVPIEPDSQVDPHLRARRRTRWVYTTAGVGFSTIDRRLFCPPELVVIDC